MSPVIAVNLGAVEAFESLPFGTYLGSIDKIKHMPPRVEGKFAQLMVTYTVIDGDALGKKQSEFLSMSPKAAFRLKKWFAKFGLGDTDNLDIDDDTELLLDPDLVGTNVVFAVKPDGERVRTELVSVEDDGVPVVAPKRAVTARERIASQPAPVVETRVATPEEIAAKTKADKLAAAKAALAALEAEEDETTEELEAAPVAAPRRPTAAASTQPQPARRTLR